LKKTPENNSNPDDKFMQILAFCQGKKSVSVRDIQRSSIGSNLSADAVKYAFQRLEEMGHGTVTSERIGGSVRVSFIPF
jgi:primase-polymerase (primpol)-like protein